jgi:hypothetical protein
MTFLKAIRITHPQEIQFNNGVTPMEGPDSLREFYNQAPRAYQWLEDSLGGRALFFYVRTEAGLGVLPEWQIEVLKKECPDFYLTKFLLPKNIIMYNSDLWESGPLLNCPVTFDLDENQYDNPEYQNKIRSDWENIKVSRVDVLKGEVPRIEGVCLSIPPELIIRQYKITELETTNDH